MWSIGDIGQRPERSKNKELKHEQMTLKELSNINQITRKLITDYITKNNISENKFSKDAGISQNQLWIYLHSGNEKKGIHTTTLEKIGKFLNTKNK